MENDCLFCKIVNKEIPSKIVYEDDDVLAFRDINPKAPIHILVIPKKHIDSVMDIKTEDTELLGKVFNGIREVAKKEGISERGFRVVSNCGKEGGQEVKHLHFHVLGGKQF